jgi:hypothetical protein
MMELVQFEFLPIATYFLISRNAGVVQRFNTRTAGPRARVAPEAIQAPGVFCLRERKVDDTAAIRSIFGVFPGRIRPDSLASCVGDVRELWAHSVVQCVSLRSPKTRRASRRGRTQKGERHRTTTTKGIWCKVGLTQAALRFLSQRTKTGVLMSCPSTGVGT